MSAASVLVRGGRAYLLSDAAHYHRDGTVIGFGSKVTRCGRLRLALTVSGCANTGTDEAIKAWLAGFRAQRDALMSLPLLLEDLERDNAGVQAVNDTTGGLPPYIRAAVAAFDLEQKQPVAFVASSTGDSNSPAPGRMICVMDAISPPVDRALVPDAPFYPVAHGRAILEAQRPFRHDDGGRFVGGWGELTTVGPEGVSTRTIIRWPQDRLGEHIRPAGATIDS